jgi:hypothetical protein
MSALPSIDMMRTIEIRQELESYDITIRSSWGAEELALALKRARVESAERNRLTRLQHQRQQAFIENLLRQQREQQQQQHSRQYYEQQMAMMEDDNDSACIDVERIDVTEEEEEDSDDNSGNNKLRRKIIARIGGFLSRKKDRSKKKAKSNQKNGGQKTLLLEPEVPFFLDFLEKEEANKGPISVEVVRLRTRITRDDNEDEDENENGDDALTASNDYGDASADARRKRILYTRGLGRSNKRKTTKQQHRKVPRIVPLEELHSIDDDGHNDHNIRSSTSGSSSSSNNSFIGTYSRAGSDRRVDVHHPFQIDLEDETTTHKLHVDDPSLVDATVIDVPAQHLPNVHMRRGSSDPTTTTRHHGNLSCDDWHGLTA